MNEQSYKSLVLRKFHAFSRNQTPIISYLSCVVGKNGKPHGRKNKKKIFIQCTFLKNNPYICNDNPQGLSDILVKL